MSVRRTDGPSWKIHVCSRNKWTLLQNYEKVAPGNEEQLFSKTVSVAASERNQKAWKHLFTNNAVIELILKDLTARNRKFLKLKEAF